VWFAAPSRQTFRRKKLTMACNFTRAYAADEGVVGCTRGGCAPRISDRFKGWWRETGRIGFPRPPLDGCPTRIVHLRETWSGACSDANGKPARTPRSWKLPNGTTSFKPRLTIANNQGVTILVCMKSDLGGCRWICVLSLVLCSSCMSPMKRAERHYQTGMSKIQSGDQTNALIELSRAIKLHPKYEEAYLARGKAGQALSDFRGAVKDYDAVIELDPSNEPAFYNRGVCKLRLKDDRSALADFTEAVKLEPDDVKAYNFRSLARVNLLDRNGALDDLNKFV